MKVKRVWRKSSEKSYEQ